ncbi:hypothetical protein BO71DRAFT_90175 [Aspergillus ellipticus CBS 707.79]|uniref:Uncharacterized protein n=1 Tax=Aspergillus ellipticus CBS 707.79 TaxID=1448320 RepID=A0A319D6H2_9EURO|nr:hypothetical protein BO71DRAFT_90175 [Aspergillus ellipticus CBS 707.79]
MGGLGVVWGWCGVGRVGWRAINGSRGSVDEGMRISGGGSRQLGGAAESRGWCLRLRGGKYTLGVSVTTECIHFNEESKQRGVLSFFFFFRLFFVTYYFQSSSRRRRD